MKLHLRSLPTLRSALLRRLALWMLAASFMAVSFSSFAGVFVSVSIAPPPLPIYAQPIMPGAGYIWTPGYWAYGDGGYFWVPGTWVLAPYVGALWTPGYWGWSNGFYVFNRGYWGRHVGFYGGINYGYGYDGVGYRGGYWNHGRFNYNRNVGYNTNISRVSYNGGRGGLMSRPTAQDQLATRDRHMQPLAAQQQQARMASQNRSMRASVNHGMPAIAATPRAGAFNTQRSASYAPRNNSTQRGMSYNRANSYARPTRSAAGYQGNPRPTSASYRPAARSYQQPRPQGHAQPARGGGNRGARNEKH
ncbi:YXWGXW repeat-containing protein [Rhodanobacter sp. C03]|uniref:YXWGXW repeat-containing protein n=1 Tax=Rhodanobacter sp. C03 TaxID=1945858 RepID=UPI0009C78C07|nr:YXWGXW repeat-containing protein [Rhodanobacter sp. C03]OOG60230.1 hypothetical protein B0E48_05635 [Rhodanobacter sp. C03]